MARQPCASRVRSLLVLSLVLVLEAMWVAPVPAVAMPAAPAPQAPEAPIASPLVIPDTTLRVSESSDGDQGDGLSSSAYVSSEGRFVTFHTQASTLVDYFVYTEPGPSDADRPLVVAADHPWDRRLSDAPTVVVGCSTAGDRRPHRSVSVGELNGSRFGSSEFDADIPR